MNHSQLRDLVLNVLSEAHADTTIDEYTPTHMRALLGALNMPTDEQTILGEALEWFNDEDMFDWNGVRTEIPDWVREARELGEDK